MYIAAMHMSTLLPTYIYLIDLSACIYMVVLLSCICDACIYIYIGGLPSRAPLTHRRPTMCRTTPRDHST